MGTIFLSVMTPKLRTRRRRSSSRHGAAKTANVFGGLGALLTTFLLAVILSTGPLILGASRLWVELPLFGVLALLLLIQGIRLVGKPAEATQRRVDAIDLSVILFVVYAVVRWLTSPAAYFSRIEVMDIVACAGVFLTCRYGMPNRRHGVVLLYLLVVVGVAETAFGYYLSNHLDWLPFGPAERLQLDFAPRWLGTYNNPNAYANLLVLAIGAALALGSFSKLPWPARIILFYLALMMLLAVVCSGSRGGWIALGASICGLVVMGLRNGAVRWWIPVTGAFILLCLIVTLLVQLSIPRPRLHEARLMLEGAARKPDIHAQLATATIRIAHDHPLFGAGPGTFPLIHPRYPDGGLTSGANLTHNDFLHCLDDYGLVGFALAMFFVTAVTLKLFQPLDVDNRWQDRVLIAVGFSSWTALLAHSLIDFNLHNPANALLLFSLTGLALGRLREEKPGQGSTISLAPLGRWLGGGLIVGSLIYGVEVARTTLGDWTYENVAAHQNETSFVGSIQGAQEALNYDRGNAQDLVLLGDLHRSQARFQKSDTDRADEAKKALDAYEKALQTNSLDDSVQPRIGMALDLMGKYAEALPHFLAAVKAQPENGQFWYWLGQHYREAGMPDQAQQAFAMAQKCPTGYIDLDGVAHPARH